MTIIAGIPPLWPSVTVRYSESQEQSAEILRQIVPVMAEHEAAYHPHTYTIWYEHVAGINLPLSATLSDRLAAGGPLTDGDVFELHAIYVAGRDLDIAKRMQRELYALLDTTADEAVSASAQAEVLEQRVQSTAARLTPPPESRDLQPIVGELLEQVRELCALTSSLSTSLARRSQDARALADRFTRLSSEAVVDPLTGLKNRRGFQEAITRLIAEGTDLTRAAFIMTDIDHFKAINDRHGHLLGDKVIHAVAQILQSSIKGRDIAVRLGGEEFGVLLPDTPLLGAMAVAEQIRTRVQSLAIRRPGKEVVGTFTVSVGVAASEPTLEALMARADGALYAAKRQGRNRVMSSRTGAG
jgi:diguanylate cyclase